MVKTNNIKLSSTYNGIIIIIINIIFSIIGVCGITVLSLLRTLPTPSSSSTCFLLYSKIHKHAKCQYDKTF